MIEKRSNVYDWTHVSEAVPDDDRDVLLENEFGRILLGHWWDFEKTFWNINGEIKGVVYWKDIERRKA